MASVIPQNKKNSFREDIFNGIQDSDVFVPCRGGGGEGVVLYFPPCKTVGL